MDRVYIDKQEIIQVVDVEVENVSNWYDDELTTGQTHWGNKGDLSKEIIINCVLDSEQYRVEGRIYENLRELTKKKAVPIIVDDISFNGIIKEMSIDISGGEYKYEYSITVAESTPYRTTYKEFNTFNQKVEPIKTKSNSVGYIVELLRGKPPIFKCDLVKNIQEIYYLQDLLRLEGYYIWHPVDSTPFRRDGYWCERMQSEYKRWQEERIGIAPTGRFDNSTRKYIMNKYNINREIL